MYYKQRLIVMGFIEFFIDKLFCWIILAAFSTTALI